MMEHGEKVDITPRVTGPTVNLYIDEEYIPFFGTMKSSTRI